MTTSAEYDLFREISMAGGTVSIYPQNISTFKNASKNLTYAAIAHRCQVNTISWDKKLEGMTNDVIQTKDPTTSGGQTKPLVIIQAKYCCLPVRPNPVLVVCTVGGVMIYEWNGSAMLAWLPIHKNGSEDFCFSKGIASIGENILVGSFTGDIFVFQVKESSVKHKTTLKEHTTPIADLGSDQEVLLASVSSDGAITCWDSATKVTNKISTGQPMSCVTVYCNYVICGTILGQVMIYSGKTGEIVCDIAAHARIITSVDIAFESGLLLTTSEDSFVRIWKTHIREKKPEPFAVDAPFSYCVENVPLVGGCFNDSRGASFSVTGFDMPVIYYFKYSKKEKASSSK